MEASDYISSFAAIIATASLFWVVFKNLLLKPRVRVRISFLEVSGLKEGKSEPRTLIETINLGPGDIKINFLFLRQRTLEKILVKENDVYAQLYDTTDPLTQHLPMVLPSGHNHNLTLRNVDKHFFKDERINQVGIKDVFGRIHWCTRKNYEEAKAEYLKYND